MRKPAFCICENKDADQLCGNHTADQRLCFRYLDVQSLFLIRILEEKGLYYLWCKKGGYQLRHGFHIYKT